jgi:type I restriction enzyme, S subunit
MKSVLNRVDEMSADVEMPEGWAAVTLEDIGNLYCGQSPATKFVNTTRTGTPYITGPDQWDGDHLHVDKWTTDPRRIVPQGCIFVTVKGAGVGTIFPGVMGAIGRDIYAFKPAAEVLDSFVQCALEFTVSEIKKNAAGDIPGLSKDHLLKHGVKVPPREEQTRIMEAIDNLFVLTKSARDRLSRVPAILKRFRQAVLAAACSGRLTEDWRGEHAEVPTATVLLDRICNERPPTGRIKADNASEADFQIPDGWKFCSLEQIRANKPHAIKAGPFGSALTKKCYTQNGYKIYGQEQVIRGDAEYGDYYIGEEKFQELKACAVASGDLLISLVGTIGKVLVVPETFAKGIINPRLVKISLHPDIYPRYLAAYLASDLAMRMLRDKSHGGTMEILNLRMLRELPIPLPPQPEQYEIIRRVKSLVTIADAIELHVSSATVRADKLTQSILAKAFRGELVPTEAELARREGREYESASVLLERIKTEKASSDSGK